jgi:beta-lactamase class A
MLKTDTGKYLGQYLCVWEVPFLPPPGPRSTLSEVRSAVSTTRDVALQAAPAPLTEPPVMLSAAATAFTLALLSPVVLPGGGWHAATPADPSGRTPVLQFQGEVLHPETRRGIADVVVFLEGMPDSVRTDAGGRFTLAAAPERALVIEHPEFRGLRFPAEHLPAGAEILAVPHLRVPAARGPQPTPLIIVRGPGSSLIGTVAASEGEGTWCGADDANSAAARDAIEAIRIIQNGPNRVAEAQFGPTATSGVILVTCKASVTSQTDHREILRARFQATLEALVEDYEGVAGVHVVDLTDGTRFAVRDDFVFPQASAIKVPILIELFRRAETEPGLLSRRVEMTDAVRTGGSGVLRHLTDGGSALSLEDHAVFMILYSDNTSTNVLIDALGMDAVNALSASLGAPGTLLQRKMIRPEESARGNENLSTPRDAARIMERLADCDLPMTEASCARVQEILAIPKGGPFVDPIPSNVPVAWKPGGITGVATAWGAVNLPDRPYVLVVMSSFGGDGGGLIREVSDATWRYFSRLAGVTDYGTRVPLDVKQRVEAGGGGG